MPGGRPTVMTLEVKDTIIRRVTTGEGITRMCREDPALPNQGTVYEHLAKDRVFAERYARAKEAQMDAMAEEIMDIADDGSNDTYTDAEGFDHVNYDHIQRSKLRVDTRKWLMAKLAPKKYGEKQEITVGPKEAPPGADSLGSEERAKLREILSKVPSSTPVE